MGRPKVIVVTDGDQVARGAVEEAARNVGGCTISASAGSPTELNARELVALIKQARREPVLVMVDDHGSRRKGQGEATLEGLLRSQEIDVVGVVAVASNTVKVMGVPVTYSVDADGQLVEGPVDKEGIPEEVGHERVEGDTVDVLNQFDVPAVGLGDPGKMHRRDLSRQGAPITTLAVRAIMDLSEGRTPGGPATEA